jgi:hypothetical protein
MTLLLCPADGCRAFGRHTTTCDSETCRGCIPRQAAPGLRLCDYHMLRIATDATKCADLHHELESALAAPERPGEHTSGTPTHGTSINERALIMRAEIRHTMASWCRLIAEERGIGLPADHIDAIGAYLALHREWLSAHPAAPDCADELASLAHRAHNVAYPSGARSFPVGPCPESGCEATVRVVLRRIDAVLPSELVCDAEQPHSWPASRWRELGRTITNPRYASAGEIAQRWALPMGSVYRLASEARWRRTEDGRRPVLYYVCDVEATFAGRGT